MLKTVIVILFISVLISLTTGLGFLFRDQGEPTSRRTLYALGLRIILATSLLATTFYGISTGQLTMDAPWHQHTANTP